MTSPPERPARRRLPVTVVTGFLGCGKTTLINRILTETHGQRLGVVVNDFGEIPLDAAQLAGSADAIAELTNGCLCCGDLRGDLPRTLARLATEAADLDGLVVETSGLADPAAVVDAIVQGGYARDLVLDAILTLVDCANFDANLAHATVAIQQFTMADLLVLTKTDLVDASSVELIEQRLRGVNPNAGIVPGGGKLPIEVLFGLGATGFKPTENRPEAGHGLDCITLELQEPLHAARFSNWAEQLPNAVVRSKGIVRFANQPGAYVVHSVGSRVDLQCATAAVAVLLADRGIVLTVFGRRLDREELLVGLRACAEPRFCLPR